MSEQYFSPPPISGACDKGLDAYSHYTDQLLGYGPDLRALFDAADATPDCALLQAHAAALHLAFESSEGWQMAKPYLKRMQQARKNIHPQEAMFCEAVALWSKRDWRSALAHLMALTEQWPNDIVALKWGQYHAFNLGDQKSLLALGERAIRHFSGAPYVHGLYAFALEQSHDLEGAEQQARKAVEIALDDAWAHHALAHVMETRGQAEEGANWLEHCTHLWDAKGVFIREHNWWHLALFYLQLGNHNRVLEIYDQHLWGEWPEFPQEQIGAASMLWRMKLSGIDGGSRWQPVLEQARLRANDKLFAFHDLHYLFALISAGEEKEVSSHINSLEQLAMTPNACPSWRAALPAAHGILAYARGDYAEAETCLATALPKLEQIGGSHAQRAIFNETLRAARSSKSSAGVL